MVVLSLLRPTARSVRSLPRFASPCASCRHRWTTIVWTDGSVKLNERFIPLPNQSLSRFGLDPRESPPRGWPAAPSGPAGPERRRAVESLWLLKWSPGQRESPFGIVDSDSRLHRRLPQKAAPEGCRRRRNGDVHPAPSPKNPTWREDPCASPLGFATAVSTGRSFDTGRRVARRTSEGNCIRSSLRRT